MLHLLQYFFYMKYNKLFSISAIFAAAVLAAACGGNANPEAKPGEEEKPTLIDGELTNVLPVKNLDGKNN